MLTNAKKLVKIRNWRTVEGRCRQCALCATAYDNKEIMSARAREAKNSLLRLRLLS